MTIILLLPLILEGLLSATSESMCMKYRLTTQENVWLGDVTILGPIAHSVVGPTAYPGFMSSIPDQCHTFMEIDHEITSLVIRLLLLIQ